MLLHEPLTLCHPLGPPAAAELRALLGVYGVSGSEVDVVVRQADTDGDNQISFEEFVAWLSSNTDSIQVRQTLYEREGREFCVGGTWGGAGAGCCLPA